MMWMRAWHCFYGRSEILPKSVILDALEEAGVNMYEVDPGAPSGPGVLFFEEITQQLCDFLREVSGNGLRRILALARSRPALAESGAWRLQTNFRLVCTTNKQLQEEVAQGRFRQDLYYRIATWTCRLPPLRERMEDILPLAHHFMRRPEAAEGPPELDESVREYLLKREYPANVRDLKQLASRIMYRHVGPGPITVGYIPEEERPAVEFDMGDWRDAAFEHAIRRALELGVGLKEIGRAVTNTAIRIAVGDEEGNLRRAAQKLGVTDRALQMRRAARRQHEHV